MKCNYDENCTDSKTLVIVCMLQESGNFPTQGTDVRHGGDNPQQRKDELGGKKNVQCRICKERFTTRALLFHHRINQHKQYGRGNMDNLQKTPWEEGEDPFKDMDDGEKVRKVYDNNKIFILATHDEAYDGVKRTYNFPIDGIVTDEDIQVHMKEIYTRQPKAYKLNISAGVIMQNTESGEYRYFKPGANAYILEETMTVMDSKSLKRATTRLLAEDVNERIRKL
jgi:hypothetical protein